MNTLSRLLVRLANKIDMMISHPDKLPVLREEFKHLPFAGQAMQKLLDEYEFDSVLDIGCGEGHHVEVFRKAGKHVTAIDYGQSIYFKNKRPDVSTIVADFNCYEFNDSYDCIWCSHCLEHQLDSHSFLRKVHSILNEGGILAITVPPLNELIVGGHVSLWNGGLLLYRLILSGFDCRKARILQYGYNVSVLVEKKTIDVLPKLEFDFGDIWKLRMFLPEKISDSITETKEQFNGNIFVNNWSSS